MSNVLDASILNYLMTKPGQKADEIAKALNSTRTEINQRLYGALKERVRQDNAYRWSVVSGAATIPSGASAQHQPPPDTDLSRLCRYYLACLGYDDTGVSTFLTSKYDDPDYVELRELPKSSSDIDDGGAARRMLGRLRTERGRYGLYLGYPTSLRHVTSKKSDWEGMMVEPVLLFPIEQEAGGGKLIIDFSSPIVNQRPFQSFTSAERDMLMNEIVLLEQELGISGSEQRPELDELAMRLQAVRPEWPWKEDTDPTSLGGNRQSISALKESGIYNRAVIIMAERSPYTQGLEKELRELATADRTIGGTALGRWLGGNTATTEPPAAAAAPLLEVLPMNLEQREAVFAALHRPLTIITGPPGTGKSQVVTNLLVNAAWQGKRVLFASKNNKAVDVVETRVNALGPRPALLRVGAQAYQARLAEFVLALLAATTTKTERDDYVEAKARHEALMQEHQRLANEASALVALRNEVDRLEQTAEEGRPALGEELFRRAQEIDPDQSRAAVALIQSALDRADREKARGLARLLWPLGRSRKMRALGAAMASRRATFASLGVVLPTAPTTDSGIAPVRVAVDRASALVNHLEKARAYLLALGRLQNVRPLEAIDREERDLQDRIARHSIQLWKLWLRLQPSRLSAQERQNLGRYTALLRMVTEAGDEGQLSKQAYAQYAQLLQEISHLLPCWAVTSLSARGRIPFQPAVFDIVVFDEASQCDIASALPLLYRAKSVVVIGDPKQLSHISGLKRGQDQALLEKNGLLEKFPHWAYSHQSLFGLAATQVAGDEVVSLVDHHRSHADIINFANREFYEDRLRVATSYDQLRRPASREPGVRWVNVKGKAVRPGTGGAVNTAEVQAVVDTLRDLVLGKGYAGSVGVVTPFRAQANAITQLVNKDDVLSAALIQRGFIAQTVHTFQGDERDVMIFSPTVAHGMTPGGLSFLRSNGNLFNVAITRARAQLIVVGDMAACAASEIGYLSRFAAYSASLSEDRDEADQESETELGAEYPTVGRPELVSDWEKVFYVAAFKAGFRLIPQRNVEKYIVDFLLEYRGRSLVIEIDGERYHRNWNGELCRRDQIRNHRLFELGYDVQRFWVYEVRDDLAGCLSRLRRWQDGGAN